MKHDLKRLRKQFKTLPDKQITPVINRALNKAGKKVQSKATKDISKATGIKPQKKVREAIKFVKSNFKSLRVLIIAHRLAPNLIEFVAPSKRRPNAFDKKTGVKAKAWGKPEEYRGTWIGTGQHSGKALVYRKTNKTASGVKGVPGPSVRRTFIEKNINAALRTTGRTSFLEEYRRDAKYRIHKHLTRGKIKK